MDSSLNHQIAAMPGEAALPRQNGELVFATPWEARAFGLAVALQEGGVYKWGEFSAALTAEIARAERAGDDSTYYERWLMGLENLLVSGGIVTPQEISEHMAQHAAHQEHDDHHHDH